MPRQRDAIDRQFRAYHDVLFDRAPRASASDLEAHARQVGLDAAAFDRCVDAKKHAAAVEKDSEEGKRLGVTGTPGFFINSRFLTGAQPLDAFVQIIEDELRPANAKQWPGVPAPRDCPGVSEGMTVSSNGSAARRLLAGLALTLAAVAGPAGADEPLAGPAGPGVVQVDPARRLVTVDVRDVPLEEVLDRLGRQAGLQVTVRGSGSARVTAAFTAVPLEDAVRRLARGHSLALSYAPARDGSRGSLLAEIRLYGAEAPRPEAPPVATATPGEWVARLLSTPDPSARRAALRKAFLPGHEGMAAGLAEVLERDPDASVRAEAVRLLSRAKGPEAVAALDQALADSDPSVRRQAVQAYAAAEPADLASQILAAVLAQDPSPLVRQQAAQSLGRLPTEDAGRALAAAAADTSPGVRRAATSALATWEKRRAASR